MPASIEFGYCKNLLGVAGQTAAEIYTAISKSKGLTSLVLEGSTAVPDCDITVVDTVATLLNVRPYIHSNMIVIVCDSPVNLAGLKDVDPFDYTGDLFSTFELRQPPKQFPKAFEPVRISRNKADMVREAIQAIVVRGFLSDFNAVNAKLNKPARTQLRTKLITVMMELGTVDAIEEFLTSMAVEHEVFVEKLRSPYFKALSQACVYLVKGHSLQYVKKQFGITDDYEITFFSKMLSAVEDKK